MKKIYNSCMGHAHAFVHALASEFRYFYSDKPVLVSFVGVAVVIFTLYAYCYSHQTLPELGVVVVDYDNTPTSRKFLRMVQASNDMTLCGVETDLISAQRQVLASRARGIIVIPEHFSKDLVKNQQVHVSVYADGAYLLYYKQILTAIKEIAAYFNAGIQIKKKMLDGNTAKQASNAVQPVLGKTVDLYNPGSGYGTFLMPVILVIVLQTTMLNAMGILGGTLSEAGSLTTVYPNAARRFGTLPVVLGKACAYVLTGLCLVVFFVSIVLPGFKIPVRTNMLATIVFMVPYLLSVACLGLFLLTFFQKRETAVAVIMFTSIPALMLTGISWPDQDIPATLAILRHLIPSTPGTKGFVSLTQMGADFTIIKDTWVQLWGLFLFYFILAALSLKRLWILELETKTGLSLKYQ